MDGGNVPIDKHNLKVVFAESPGLRNGNTTVMDFNGVLEWYQRVNIKDADPAALRTWFEALPDNLNLRDLLTAAEDQAYEAIVALTALADNPSIGKNMTREEYKKAEFYKYKPELVNSQ